MKWTENGIIFEGTPAEYRELHVNVFRQPHLLTRCARRGRHVTVDIANGEAVEFKTVLEAAQWITQKIGRYVPASTFGKLLDSNGHVCMERFIGNSVSLFDNNAPQTQGEENVN